jgi:hypothetical protein
MPRRRVPVKAIDIIAAFALPAIVSPSILAVHVIFILIGEVTWVR